MSSSMEDGERITITEQANGVYLRLFEVNYNVNNCKFYLFKTMDETQIERFIKIELDFNIKENYSFFNALKMFKKEHEDKVKIVECRAIRQHVHEKIKQDILCQDSKIQQQSKLSRTSEHDTNHDSGTISTNIEQEIDVCEVTEDDVLTCNTDIKKELDTEVLTTHCDLPTLKDENIDIDDLDCLKVPCSNKQIKKISKSLNHNANHFFKYKRKRYPHLVCQKSGDLDEKQLFSSKLRGTKDHSRILQRRKNKCIYCDLPVNNFARHLQRHHADELEVQNIIVLPKRDKRRKEMIYKIRKKGRFSSGNVIPVQKKETATNDAGSDLSNICSENRLESSGSDYEPDITGSSKIRQSSRLESSGSDCEPDITGSIGSNSNTNDAGYIEIQGHIIDSNLSEDSTIKDVLDNSPLDDIIIDQTNSICKITDVSTVVDQNDQETNLPAPPKKVLELKNRRFKRKRHNCIYCDVIVSNFSRHLKRHHADELEVQNILQLPKWDKRRKAMMEKIRKEGDFHSATIIPVRDNKSASNDPCSKLPCIYCSGYYSRKALSRHVKRCPLNKNKSYKRNYQSIGQTYMANNFRPNDVLRTSGVLDSLTADEISLVAKKDKIICEVGRKFLKCHQNKHLATLSKTYMRRLARLLIEIRKIENNGSLALINILHPSKFKTIVQALKAISHYDEVGKTFKSPSLAMQMGNILKKAISVAHYLEMKVNKNSPRLKFFDELIQLINEKWAMQVSTEACQNLYVNSFNKTPIIPLIQDLQKMRLYLDDLISNAKIKLQENNKSEYAYRTLMEGTYCSLFLFNRRRIGELQNIMLDTYATHLNSTEEFGKLLWPSERILLNKLKRIVIKKHRREVQVLIDKSTQEGIDVALEHRNNFVDKSNPYLFGLCHTERHISGDYIFRKHVKNALNDPNKVSSLSSTKLRNHLATIVHILEMDTGDLNQLARFMGHTAETNSEWYTPWDLHQTAKVSKILLLAQSECIDKYKGQNLNDIELDLIVIETRLDTDDEQEDINVEDENKSSPITVFEQSLDQNVREQENKPIRRISWTKQEKELTEKHFRKHILEKIPPKKNEVMDFVELYPKIFSNRKWDVIKAYVCNQYRFMGYTAKTNSELDRLPSDIDQVAKDLKIILAQNECIDNYKGQNLNDNKLDPTVIETRLHTDDEKDINMENENKSPSVTVFKQSLDQIIENKEKTKIRRITWTEEEKELTKTHFRKHILNKIPPKKDEVMSFVELYPKIFSNRKWDVIKAYVYNQYNKK